jgi:hypothetical protein
LSGCNLHDKRVPAPCPAGRHTSRSTAVLTGTEVGGEKQKQRCAQTAVPSAAPLPAQEADEEQLRTADDAAAGVAARLEQLRTERAALEEHKAATERELAATCGALDGRRAERSRLQDEARRAKCAAGRRRRNSAGLHFLGCTRIVSTARMLQRAAWAHSWACTQTARQAGSAPKRCTSAASEPARRTHGATLTGEVRACAAAQRAARQAHARPGRGGGGAEGRQGRPQGERARPPPGRRRRAAQAPHPGCSPAPRRRRPRCAAAASASPLAPPADGAHAAAAAARARLSSPAGCGAQACLAVLPYPTLPFYTLS